MLVGCWCRDSLYRQCHLFASIMLTDGFHGDVDIFVAAQFVAYRSCSMRELNWVDSRSLRVVALGRRVTLRHLDHCIQVAFTLSLDSTLVLV